jgi:hypothetical protein
MKRTRRRSSQKRALWLISVLVAVTMVCSLGVALLPPRQQAVAPDWPTPWAATPAPDPTPTPTVTPTP